MAHSNRDDFEHQLQIRPAAQTDTFEVVYPPWHHPHQKAVNGAIMLGQSTLAACQTVPEGFTVHALHAHFVKAAPIGSTLHYEVERVSTTTRTACRIVRVMQTGIVRVLATFSFMKPSKEDETRQPFDHVPEPSRDTLEAAARPIDPELDDADQSAPGSKNKSRAPEGWPASTPYPAVSNQRQEVSHDESISKRIYRIKMRTLTPLSSPAAQTMATIFFSDFYVLDTPLSVQNIPFGMHRIGDKTKRPTRSALRSFATLNHSIHFVASSGWDVHDGLLMECVTEWAKGRRAGVCFNLWDARGKLVATGEQEGYFLFNEAAKGETSRM
ncbi:hypothetical protein M409DRAFT_29801 [Zasmidium cellare ATCC 36951]|uniref:Thioesterase domain-containing protein n=1 Tax=Zasmidium cellare ATCC 36951 TaxID=1080233 RepID=A0A6A6C1V1_ZASCE|nr:uncharacterized protein M409DRAFT_29801 [Zasmidium cellare ATCC 36951]KAF2159802.1 hypothetical protein M409DRAFT_29801 [Zasmidium cellare ATCC 36951]